MRWVLNAALILIGINAIFFGVLWIIATIEEWEDRK